MADSNGLLPLLTPPAPGLNLGADAGPKIIAVTVVCILITIVAVALRIWARRVSMAGLWWDDYTIILGMLFSWIPFLMLVGSLHLGFGKHIAAEGGFLQRIIIASNWFKLFYVFEIVYTTALTLPKYSILLFYSRIFKTRGFTIALWTVGTLVTLEYIAVVLVEIFQCIPVHALWDFGPGRCINLKGFFIGTGVLNTITDAIILVLPLPLIWTLRIDRTQRLALSGVFLLGGFIVIVSIIRTAVLSQLQEVDITWEFVSASIWSSVEPPIAVCSACLPIMRSLWIRSRAPSQVSSAARSAKRTIQSMTTSIIRNPTPAYDNNNSNSNKYSSNSKDMDITSSTHLNELSAEQELPWGNHVEIYATHRRSTSSSEQAFGDVISLKELDANQRHSATRPPLKHQVSWLDDAGALEASRLPMPSPSVGRSNSRGARSISRGRSTPIQIPEDREPVELSAYRSPINF